ncbi:MAG: PAS domain-containing protein [Alphaproteobacteria bacterium]
MTLGQDVAPPPLRPAAECPAPPAQSLLAWWQALPRSGRWPDWAAIDKRDLKPWMGWIVLYDVIDGGSDHRYRLVGSHIAERSGLDLTGKLVSEASYTTRHDQFLIQLDRLRQAGEPAWINAVTSTARGYSAVHDRLCLPFANGGTNLAIWLFYVCGDEILVDPYRRG